MATWRNDPACRQETLLFDLVRRLAGYRRGRRAVHFHLSRLRPYNLRDHHLRIALTAFDMLITHFEGSLFRLQSGDLMLLTKGAEVDEIALVVTRLHYLFGDDPLFNSCQGEAAGTSRAPGAPGVSGTGGGELCTWYDLETDYDELLEAVRVIVTAATPPSGETESAEALDLIKLDQVERSLMSADMTPFLRCQAVCKVAPQATLAPQAVAVFREIYVSIADLQKAYLPKHNLAGNRWLFQHLTEILDRRVLASLMSRDSDHRIRDVSLNLNISTVLSAEFLRFDKAIDPSARGTITIEVQPIDVHADIGAFMFARDFLTERGYKLCLDGLKHLSLPLVNRAWLGVDLVKFHWGHDLIDDLDGKRREALKAIAGEIGPERLILTRCDSPDAALAGADLGIALYQGRLFDKQLQEQRGSPTSETATPEG